MDTLADANSRKISIPKTGTLVVGAGINTTTGIMQVDTDTGVFSPHS